MDTAREYTYRADFPAKAPFARNLWTREAVLAWFDQLPTRDRRSTKAATTTTTNANLKPTTTSKTSKTSKTTTSTSTVPPSTESTPAATTPKRLKSYAPQSAR